MNGEVDLPAVSVPSNKLPLAEDLNISSKFTFRISKNKIRLLYSDQFEIDETKNKDYWIPNEYYIMSDLYYAGTSCTIDG